MFRSAGKGTCSDGDEAVLAALGGMHVRAEDQEKLARLTAHHREAYERLTREPLDAWDPVVIFDAIWR
jgi:hypothetical protein